MTRRFSLAGFFRQLTRVAGGAGQRFHGCHACPDALPAVTARAASGCEPTFPVDVVYTWVDGSDPRHAEKRRKHQRSAVGIHTENLDNARYRDNDELKYSLRALERFAPWVNRVHIVSDGQTPDWLDSAHPRVALVRHADILPERFLPTFNSHVIESRLHRIPGLAEHYLYFNDDFFLTARAEKGDFFTANGLPHIFCDWRRSRLLGYLANRTPHAASYFNVIDHLAARGLPLRTAPIAAHGPYPMTKTCAEAAFAFFAEAIEGFSANKFRTIREMAFYCHAAPLWAYATRRAIPCDRGYYYFNIRRPDRRQYYRALLAGDNVRDERPQPLFACFNDVDGTWLPDSGARDLARFLSAFYPQPSSFEK